MICPTLVITNELLSDAELEDFFIKNEGSGIGFDLSRISFELLEPLYNQTLKLLIAYRERGKQPSPSLMTFYTHIKELSFGARYGTGAQKMKDSYYKSQGDKVSTDYGKLEARVMAQADQFYDKNKPEIEKRLDAGESPAAIADDLAGRFVDTSGPRAKITIPLKPKRTMKDPLTHSPFKSLQHIKKALPKERR